MKKLIALLLCLVVTVSLFAGCTGGEGGNDGGTGSNQNNNNNTTDDYPDGLTLTIGLPTNANVEDYDTNGYTLWLEEQTGFNLEFQLFAASSTDYKSQLSTMLAGNQELPDILWNFNVGTGVYEEYGANGYLYDMASFYNDKEGKAKVFWERLSELPQEQQDYVVEALTADDGGMYAFARIEYSLIDTMQYQVYINQDWLDKLGLDMPDSPESLRTVLEAFRDRDPNGNGKADEKPLIGSTSAFCGNIVQWIINMFVYCNNARYFNVDENNNLYLPHVTDAYREALIYINDLIKDKLMYTSAFSMTNKEIKSMLNPPKGEALTVGMWSGHPTLCLEVDNDSVYAYTAVPYWSPAVRHEQAFTPATFITQDCEYPAAAWDLFMVMCTTEGSYRQRYGIKGVDWVDADPGTTSFLGQPAELKILNEAAFGNIGNSLWGSIQGTILNQAENEACQLTEDMGEWINAKMEMMGDCYFYYCDAEEMYNPDEEYILPQLDVPDSISEADKTERNNCTSLISEATSSFCCGTGTYNNPRDDAQWAAYIAELEELGYKTWMANREKLYHEQYPERG